MRVELDALGFVVVPRILDDGGIAAVEQVVAKIACSEAVRQRGGVYAIRNLLEISPGLAPLVRSSTIQSLADSVLDGQATLVRATMFDKTPGANWLVPWHQDLTICVEERVEAPGFGPWTLKAGVQHVQPPIEILETMVAIRVHLDDCGVDNGALRLLPRTHRLGRLSPDQIEEARARTEPVTVAMSRGGALVMRPLLLHASGPAVQPRHRRVVHLEFAAKQLPFGLRWLSTPSERTPNSSLQ